MLVFVKKDPTNLNPPLSSCSVLIMALYRIVESAQCWVCPPLSLKALWVNKQNQYFLNGHGVV